MRFREFLLNVSRTNPLNFNSLIFSDQIVLFCLLFVASLDKYGARTNTAHGLTIKKKLLRFLKTTVRAIGWHSIKLIRVNNFIFLTLELAEVNVNWAELYLF